MLNASRLDADLAMLLVVDLQAKLMPLVDQHARVIRRAVQLIRGVSLVSLPVLASEQYPKGVGSTVPPVADALQAVSGRMMVKDSFSLCGDEAIREVLRGIDRPQVIVCGIESHVCVQQTVLDLVSMDHGVWVCADAAGSRRELDHRTALERMARAGANVSTVESVLFELCGNRTSTMFKPMLELIKQYDQALR